MLHDGVSGLVTCEPPCKALVPGPFIKGNRRKGLKVPVAGPIAQHLLEPVVAPYSFLVPERRVEHAAAPVGPCPRQRPSVGMPVHVWLSEIDRGGIEAQKRV